MEQIKQFFPCEQVINIKEGHHFLAEVLLFSEGIDIYKRKLSDLRKLRPQIIATKLRINAVLKESFGVTIDNFFDLSLRQIENIRQNFLRYFRNSVQESRETVVKKWIPLNQYVGYMEILTASTYLQLNNAIDAEITARLGESVENEYIRIRIVNAFKKLNQGKTVYEVDQEIGAILAQNGLDSNKIYIKEWYRIFGQINAPLQEEYATHMRDMRVNENIRDLQFRKNKRSRLLQSLVGERIHHWKPENLEHDINAQSEEVNRSLIELVCNGIDSNEDRNKPIEVNIHENGYTIEDFGSGMNPYVILEKLFIPKISGKTGKETIGRFGVGFYTVLSHLKKSSDFVRIITNDGSKTWEIEFRIHERTGDIFVHTEEKKERRKSGTKIEVQAEDFDASDAEHLCRDLLQYNGNSQIVVNDEQINKLEGYKSFEGDHTKVLYLPETEEGSKVCLLINGIVIEKFQVEGVNMVPELILDFPLTCSLPENRSEVAMDEAAIASLQEMMDNILKLNQDEDLKINLLNALAPVLIKLQKRVGSNKIRDNLPKVLQKKFRKSIETGNKVFLPNISVFQLLKIENAVYLHPGLCSTKFEAIPGINKCDRFESNDGYSLYMADFKPNSKEFLIEHEKTLIIDRTIYKRYQNTPAVLNVFLSNLNHTGNCKQEKCRGRILGAGEEKIEETPDKQPIAENVTQDTEQTTDIANTVHPVILRHIMSRLHFGDQRHENLSEKQVLSFLRLSRQDQINQVKEDILKKLNEQIAEYNKICRKFEKHEGDWGKVKGMLMMGMMHMLRNKDWKMEIIDENQRDNLLSQVSEIFEKPLPEWEKCLEKLDILNDCRVPRLRILAFIIKDIEECPENMELASSLYAILEEDMNIEIDLLFQLKNYINFAETLEIIKNYDKDILLLYLNFLRNSPLYERRLLAPPDSEEADYLLTEEESKLIFKRANQLFLKKIIKMPVDEQIKFINYISDKILVNSVNRSFIEVIHYGLYHLIPPSIRGYAMYIVEGGEILDEKGYEENRIDFSEYESSISLSKMVQAKRDNEAYFQEFRGHPQALTDFCRTSQKGIDASKAIRDIFHSLESQIVNDGYLWIREILQNSIDAIVSRKDRFSGTPQVKVNAFLRQNPPEISEQELWDMLETVIKKNYAEHVDYFRGKVEYFLVKPGQDNLTIENFESALNFLLEIKDSEEQNFFDEWELEPAEKKFSQKCDTEPDFILEISNPVGMDLNEVINYLLIPNESNKKDNEELIGKFGQGFFTIFGDAKEVCIKTGKGDGVVNYIKTTPLFDKDQNLLDFKIELKQVEEDFQGTVIQKVVKTDFPEIEATFCKNATISYGGLIDGNILELSFRDNILNVPRQILAEQEIAGLEKIKMYSANENALTQNGLFVKELDDEILSCIPENIRKFLLKSGIVIDIPAKIKLIKSRANIARKKEVLPKLQAVIPHLALKAYLKSFTAGNGDLENLPYDYFWTEGSTHVSQSIEDDARKIASGQTLGDYSDYLQDENALIQLLTCIPYIAYEDQTLSLQTLARKIKYDPDSIDLDKLPEKIKEKIQEAIYHNQERKQNEEKAKAEYNSDSAIIKDDFYLPEKAELKSKAGIYYAFDYLFQSILRACQAGNVETQYYLEVGNSVAHAPQNGQSIAYNLYFLDNTLLELAEIINNREPIKSPKVQRLLESIISTITHERQHNLENSGGWTHNKQFFRKQREILKRLILDNSLNLHEIFKHLYDNFNTSFIPVKKFINLIA
jgi:hypothetical protein